MEALSTRRGPYRFEELVLGFRLIRHAQHGDLLSLFKVGLSEAYGPMVSVEIDVGASEELLQGNQVRDAKIREMGALPW